MNPPSKALAVIAAGLVAGLLAAPAIAAPHASITRNMVVQASPDDVWRVIGPFCAIGDWHPAIGSCVQDHANRPTRTLVTRDGQATFVERQLTRNNKVHSYTYSFTSSPVPVTRYVSTFSVKASGSHASIVTWHGDYIPNPGQEAAAETTLGGIYDAGLAAIRDRFEVAQASR